MPKHHDKKPHATGVGADLMGKPDELINLLVKDPKEKKWALDQVTNEGPAHKQVFNALLLKRVFALVKSIEKMTATPFHGQTGNTMVADRPEHHVTIPIALPLHIEHDSIREDITKAIAHSPEHELVAFGALLQAIEWGIMAIDKKNNEAA